MRYVSNSILLAMLCLSPPAQATVTFDGTGGTFAKIFSQSADIDPGAGTAAGCARSGCHNGTQTNFNLYANASSGIVTTLDRVTRANNAAGFMPEGGVSIGPTLIGLLQAWQAAGTLQNAPPEVTTGSATPSKNSAAVSASVNDSGANASYVFQYGIGNFNSTQNASSSGADTTGGGTANDSKIATLNSLVCNTNYQYRIRGTNSRGTTNGNPRNVTTTACNRVPNITFAPNLVAELNQQFRLINYISDVDGGLSDSLTYSFPVASPGANSPPDGMTINSSTGEILWTPAVTIPVGTMFSVEVRVTDSQADPGFTSDQDVFVLTTAANPDNDQPILAAITGVSVTEFTALTVNAGDNLSDPDDNNDGSGAISWSLGNAPAGMLVDAFGTVTWLPMEDTAGDYAVTVTAQDGLEDGTVAVSQTLNIHVDLLDTDSDLVADYNDNCRCLANAASQDLDQDMDGQGDVCDHDVDGDGINNVPELCNGLDPLTPNNPMADTDGDGLLDVDEFVSQCDLQLNDCPTSIVNVIECPIAANDDCPVDGSTAACLAISTDSVAPTITVADMTVVSTGYVTEVTIPSSAADGNDGDVGVTADQESPFRPGRYNIVYSTQDGACNLAEETITLDVVPLVTLAGAAVTGEGQTISVPISLNGLAPDYPVQLNYSVTGAADIADHNLADGVVEIAAGALGSLDIAISADGVVEGDEEFTITLTDSSSNAVLSSPLSYTVVIVEDNVEPSVALSTLQSGIDSINVYKDQVPGVVVITANGSDPNGDTLTYDWTPTDSGLGGTATTNQYTFDASLAVPATGSYQVGVVVSDGSAQILETTTVVVGAVSPTLSNDNDADHDGTGDMDETRADLDRDGLPNYLDPVDDPTLLNARVSATENNYSRLIRSNAGVSIALGEFAIAAQRGGARIVASDVKDASGQAVTDDGFVFIGGVFDFQIRGLSRAQRTASIVLPLTQSIPPNASYRKFSNNVWSAFVSNATDSIRSAASVAGECPPPGHASYQAGLVAFVDCVELTLTDGGPNDADGQANGVIRDPGGGAIASQIPGSVTDPSAPVPPTSGPKGGGAFGWLSLLLLSLGTLFRFRKTEVISKC